MFFLKIWQLPDIWLPEWPTLLPNRWAPVLVSIDTGFPGGIFNNGFAYSWITERADDAKPAPAGGQPWARKMTTTGDPQVMQQLPFTALTPDTALMPDPGTLRCCELRDHESQPCSVPMTTTPCRVAGHATDAGRGTGAVYGTGTRQAAATK